MDAAQKMTLPPDASLSEIRELFRNDQFATQACGAVISAAEYGHAICEMEIEPKHHNANGQVMGGAIFTLADFALAIVCNVGETPTVGVSSSIQFMNTARGSKLIAECRVDKSGRSVGFYTVNVTDELGTAVAKMTATCSRKPLEGTY